jgi:hypothetical protein
LSAAKPIVFRESFGGFRSAQPTLRSKNERKWNADRRLIQPAVLLGTAAHPSRDAHAYRRSTAALPSGLLIQRCQLQAMFPGTRISAGPVTSPFLGQSRRSFCGRYPPSPVPVQRAPRGLVRSAKRLMPEAARERFASPPAGTALAPMYRCASGTGPSLSENQRAQCN